MGILRTAAILATLATLGGCAVENGAAPEEIAITRHVSDEPPYVAVVTMVDRRDGRAAHSALIINASQRVIYDPAGTFKHADLVERGDIHYGATDRMVSYYKRYHARFSHYVHEQRIPLTPEQAEAVLRRAQAQGPSPKMFCNIHITAVLNDVRFLGRLRSSFYPEVLRDQVAKIPGVQDSFVYEEDRGKVVPTG